MYTSKYKIVEDMNSGEFIAVKSILEDLRDAYDFSVHNQDEVYGGNSIKLRYQMAKAIAEIRESLSPSF